MDKINLGTLRASVAFPLAIREPLTYAVPPELAQSVQVGSLVLAPVGRVKRSGWVTALGEDLPLPKNVEARNIAAVIDPTPQWSPEMGDIFKWMASYYHCPLAQVIDTALPKGLKETRKMMARLQKGRDLSGGQADVAWARALRRLDKGALPLAALRRYWRGPVEADSAINKAVVEGWIDLFESGRKAVKRKTEDWLRRTEPEGNLTPKEAHWLQQLPESGWHAASELRQKYPGIGPYLLRLQRKGGLELDQREAMRDPFGGSLPERDSPKTLNPAQQSALDAMASVLDSGQFQPFVLEGVTGSGKTEVYLQLIARVLDSPRRALVLVPEIGLTPQLIRRFRARFGDTVAVLHSGLSDGERVDQWRRIHEGVARVTVGVRSAVFAPVPEIGVIVIDEEHDSSFKQEEGVTYNARDVALMRARALAIPIVLGSATPRLETRHRVSTGDYRLLELPERATGAPMPRVEILDVSETMSFREFSESGMITPALESAIRSTVERGEQAMLYLNRRGYHPHITCGKCGHVFECNQCAVKMTLHRGRGALICHLCGQASPEPKQCPICGSDEVGFFGTGTERLEEMIAQRLAPARVLRLDRDASSRKHGIEDILESFRRREADVLVGTQMITKGHDFPEVTLVGVLMAEAGLHFADFRAAERTFATLVQVAGRAGRGSEPGRVIVQTFMPDHPTIQLAALHDLDGFARHELSHREMLGYPPFRRLAVVRVTAPSEGEAIHWAEIVAKSLRARSKGLNLPGLEVLGPAVCPLSRVKGRHRQQVLIKSPTPSALSRALDALNELGKVPRSVRIQADVDPQNLL